MRRFLLFPLLLWATLAQSQSCPSCRYASYVFDSVDVTTVKFGEGQNADGNLQELFMDIYTPNGDTVSQRPVMIFAFGGGFLQGSRDEGYVQRACNRFAKAGYVAAAIDYRTGFDPLGLFPIPTEELMRTFFRAMQDMRGAVQWFRAHADQMGNTLRIDDNLITVGGASAGGITACLTAYCDKSSEFAEMGDTMAIAGLGGFYSSSGTYSSYSWEAQGVFSIAGAIVNTAWIEPGDPPIFSAHGDQDLTVPYQGGNFGIGPISIGLEGSYNIDQAAKAVGVCSYLFTMPGEGHPSGNESEEFLDQIFLRALPRSKAVVEGNSFCCNFTASIELPQITTDPIGFIDRESEVVGASNPAYRWCEVPCGFTSTSPDVLVPVTNVPITTILLMVTDGGCTAMDFEIIDLFATAQAPELESAWLQVSPNPSQGELQVRSSRTDLLLQSVRVLDVNGRLVTAQELDKGLEADVSLEGMPAGVYFLRLGTSKGDVWKKVILR